MMCPPSGRWEFVGVGHLLPSLKPSSLDFRTSAPNQCSLSSVLKGQQGKYKSGTKQEECFYSHTSISKKNEKYRILRKTRIIF